MNLLEAATGRIVPFGRIDRLARNATRLDELDALVVPETTSILLKTRFGANRAKLIFLPHGAGDRSISVSREMAKFDFLLLPGAKTRDRMIDQGIARDGDCAVVGYPKFESRSARHAEPLFANDRPTVLYNPHFDPMLSSWHDLGLEVLEFFARQDRFNLIFAPHVMLFRRRIQASMEHRRIRFRKSIPLEYFNLPHVRIDLGSAKCVDMTYTNFADIYLGDVSSQIYEFIRTPRPVVFLNSHRAHWRENPNYAFWSLGPVVETVQELEQALAGALPLREGARVRQVEAFNRTFDIDPERSSASRAAAAIVEFLSRDMGSGHKR